MPIGRGYGITGEKYINEIATPYIHKFYLEVKERNPGREVWLIEDNAGPHQKAARLLKPIRESLGILTIDWPPNSPYLHPIEDVWGPLKDRLQPTWKEIRGAAKVMKEKAYKAIEDVWKSDFLLMKADEAVLNWRSKLQRCYDLDGAPHFKG